VEIQLSLAKESWIARAYDGSASSFVALEAFGWGELLNLGYYPLLHTPLVLGGLGHFQRRLARESLALLDAQPGERILDAACGRGWTTAEIATRGASVLGVDLLSDAIEEARRRFGSRPGVQFTAGDTTALPGETQGFALGDDSLDGIHCLEAGFHFGPDGRQAFLEQAWRMLRPGGRLVLVDFVWQNNRPEEIADFDDKRIVRDTWRFDEFEPLERYRTRARQLGFHERKLLDWSRPVTGRFVKLGFLLAYLGNSTQGRWLLKQLFPAVSGVRDEEWPDLLALMHAHERVQKQSSYIALVLDKPGG